MIKRTILIDGWVVDVLISESAYDREGVVACLRDAGATTSEIADVIDCGDFVYFNKALLRAVVLLRE